MTERLFKKIISIICALACLAGVFSLCACAPQKNSGALTVNGIEIGNDVFTYFIDCALTELGAGAEDKVLTKRAAELASLYFKKNSLAYSEGISLTSAQKAAVSERVNAHWGIYGEYFSKLGITKETLTKVFTADSYRDALLLSHYGEGGKDEISTARLYAAFRTNYIVFQSINGYFTYVDGNGLTQSFDENQKEALILKFQNMASLVNQGEKTLEEAAEFLAESGYTGSVATVILKKGDTSYPPGFFDKVQSIDARTATVVGTADYIFLVVRGDAGAKSEYFLDKREEIIKDIAGEDIDKEIEASLETEYTLSKTDTQAIVMLVRQEKEG